MYIMKQYFIICVQRSIKKLCSIDFVNIYLFPIFSQYFLNKPGGKNLFSIGKYFPGGKELGYPTLLIS